MRRAPFQIPKKQNILHNLERGRTDRKKDQTVSETGATCLPKIPQTDYKSYSNFIFLDVGCTLLGGNDGSNTEEDSSDEIDDDTYGGMIREDKNEELQVDKNNSNKDDNDHGNDHVDHYDDSN